MGSYLDFCKERLAIAALCCVIYLLWAVFYAGFGPYSGWTVMFSILVILLAVRYGRRPAWTKPRKLGKNDWSWIHINGFKEKFIDGGVCVAVFDNAVATTRNCTGGETFWIVPFDKIKTITAEKHKRRYLLTLKCDINDIEGIQVAQGEFTVDEKTAEAIKFEEGLILSENMKEKDFEKFVSLVKQHVKVVKVPYNPKKL